jgi:hypothetical protein
VAEQNQKITWKILVQIVAWALFLLLPLYTFPHNSNYPPFKSDRFVNAYIATNILLIAFYFLNSTFLIPQILARKKTFLYVVIIVGYFFLYMSIIYLLAVNSDEVNAFIHSQYSHTPFTNFNSPPFFASSAMTQFLLMLVISTGSNIVTNWFIAEEIKEEVSKQQLQTELSFLKSQVNPHFLFNTLNTIYSLSFTNNHRTSDAVMKLSRIMRYTLEEAQRNTVSLEQEIDFIKNYIELQKIRLTNNVDISFKTNNDSSNINIAPLLFIPFIENAFKYGISTHHPSAIFVCLKENEKTIEFRCKNNIFPNISAKKGTGTGIANTKRRLELLYPDKHTFIINHSPDQFEVTLIINT